MWVDYSSLAFKDNKTSLRLKHPYYFSIQIQKKQYLTNLMATNYFDNKTKAIEK